MLPSQGPRPCRSNGLGVGPASTTLLTALCLVTIVDASTRNSLLGAIGKGANLRELDVKAALGWAASQPTVFDVGVDNACVVSSDFSWAPGSYTFYSDQQEFASDLGITSDSELSLSCAASFTVSTAYKQSASTSTQLSAATVRAASLHGDHSISADCYGRSQSYSSDFLDAFQALPTTLAYTSTGFLSVPTASRKSQWTAFADFVDTWGSHVITTIHTGAAIEFLTTAESESTSSEDTFRLDVCANANLTGISAAACVGYTSRDYSRRDTSGISTQMYAYGGNSTLAAQLSLVGSASSVNVALAQEFLSSGDNTTAAYFAYTPLWHMLAVLFGGDETNLKRVTLLEAYYSKFLAEFTMEGVDDCSLSQIDFDGNDISHDDCDDHQACQERCMQDDTCKFWTFVESQNSETCFLESSDSGFEIQTTAISGPKECGTKPEEGFEILVTESKAGDVYFDVRPCRYPIANQADCEACGNYWNTTYTTKNGAAGGCAWWACGAATATVEYCSSPDIEILPDDWLNRRTSASHYSNPSSGGCLADEKIVTITDYAGEVCAPKCEDSGACSTDIPDGFDAVPQCLLVDPGSTSPTHCTLTCDPNSKINQCGTQAWCQALPKETVGLCLYPTK